MKVLTTTGLTKLIELSKNTFLDRDNVIDVSDALATIAITGSYNDLTNKPTINDLTTSAQQAALNSGATSTNIAQITTNTNNITTINNKIPAAATSSNQLADKAFVNSSINAVAAYYITSDAEGDAFATKAALDTGPYYHDGATRTPTENDYAIVAADETKNNACTRYTYTGSQWSFQYIVNDTPFTQAQINAINSGINSTMVGYLTNVTSDIQTQINGKQATITGAASTITSSNLTASKALISNGSGKVAVLDTTSTELGYVHGVTSAIQTQINSKLNKLTYEWNNAIGFGSTGKLCIGKFCCYDSNITIDIDATTSTTYHGTLVIALQNIGTSSGGSLVATVYGDATNTIAPNIYIYKHGVNDCLVEVYFSPLPWSKNIIHIRAVTLNKDHGSVSYDSEAFDICTSVSEIPAEATIKPTNALDSKQATLVSGTNIKTVNNQSILGSGNLAVDGLPSQTSQSGKFLTTNGTTASWANVPTELPSQSGQNGKYLKTDGSSASWENVDTLPSQTSQSGKYLTTNGTTASWSEVSYNNLTNKLTAGTDITISNSNVISNTYPEVYLTEVEYQALVNTGTTDASTYYNTDSNIPGSKDDIISIKSSMSPGDTLKQGYMVLVEV